MNETLLLKRFMIGAALLAACWGGARAASRVKPLGPILIPRPEKLELTSGSLTLNAKTQILVAKPATEEVKTLAAFLKEALAPALGDRATISETELKGTAPKGAIVIGLSKGGELGEEGYTLEVTKEAAVLRAGTPKGLFYGIQTLRQLLPAQIETAGGKAKWTVPALRIEDKPRFARRGLLLDCGRHFFTKAEVKRVIDLMARYKMNVLHWHLTEDQGWRIEIKKYPRLTEIGSVRKGENNKVYPEGPQGGFYTQDDVREIVAFAARRCVTVVPEIEMPGHSTAALAAYPELSCTGGPFEVSTHWGVHKEVYCAGNDKTFEMLQDVLTEVMDLFPSKEIHLGGDECPKDRWKACAKCQARIKAEGLKDEKDLQSYFIKRIVKFLNAHGRRAICWDEVLEEGLHEGIMVQEWRGHNAAPEGSAAKAAALKMDVVVSPAPFWYLDMPLVKNATYTWGWAGNSNLADVYALEPLPEGLDPALNKYITGGEGAIWTEHIPAKRMDYFAFPRALAIAEVLWSPAEGKDFHTFYARVRAHLPRLALMGVKYGPAMPDAYDAPQDPGEDY